MRTQHRIFLIWSKVAEYGLLSLVYFFQAERPHHCWLVGFSASAERPMDSRLFVRPFVRYAISRKPRIRFWWFFAQSYILISLKKCSKRIFEKNSRFRQKIRFLYIFFESAHHLSKTWPETGDNCFESSNGSVVSGKILVLAVLAIFGSKIHCLWWHYMVLGCFWPFSSK